MNEVKALSLATLLFKISFDFVIPILSLPDFNAILDLTAFFQGAPYYQNALSDQSYGPTAMQYHKPFV